MTKLNFDYYNPSMDEVYSDGSIELELLRKVKNKDFDWYNSKEWAIIYHLSHLRQNILNWYSFEKGCTILEIGAGCGAITGLLCEKASRVVAVELTKTRAEINYYRHQNIENLEIVVCDFQSLPPDWKFDYIIINGVLEYAAYMFTGNQPYNQFLKKAKQHLSSSGKMLLSIENRIGLKYISGFREDHTGEFFSGINNYNNNERVRTFTKGELTNLLNETNLSAIKFFYPYPDYKFPTEIFTDTTINGIVPSSSHFPLDMPRVKLFDENNLHKTLMDSNSMDIFANSFLVEISATQQIPTQIDYVKISANRSEEFRIFTYFDLNNNKVYKKGLNAKSQDHLKRMLHYSDYSYDSNQIKNATCYKEVDGISMLFYTIETLEDRLVSKCTDTNTGDFIHEIVKLRNALYEGIHPSDFTNNNDFVEIFSREKPEQKLHWSSNSNLDLISGNIFLEGDLYKVIDYEWHMPFQIPLEFTLWRTLKQFKDNHKDIIDRSIVDNFIYDTLNITRATEQCFFSWEENFIKNFVKIQDLYIFANDEIPVDLNAVSTRYLKDHSIESTLFYDHGAGFTDHDFERCVTTSTDTGFSVTFKDKSINNAEALRWDPLEGNPALIYIQSIETDGSIKEITAINAERVLNNSEYEFTTYDPQFLLQGDFTNATYIKINFTCEILDWTIGYQLQEKKMYVNNQKINELVNHKEISKINKKILEEKLEEVSTQLNVTVDSLTNSQNDLIETQKSLESVQKTLEINQNKLANTQEELNIKSNKLIEIHSHLKHHRIKSIVKILFFGEITRGE
ncbi:class I SAM-dependent methyltransferase [Paenibacillus etheri]|uniref:Methyltransferase type 12 domain-containing protein n=1 Tax=Paenibacillus etheri TaxID=1306852 RepID=A0A0W1AR80_9BACL|nr:class I SAM-dependent methyltransferase [Paenibacillus etheri]KTD83774.1 hypothetical protein UQ64_26725 [Paenibacillus etheri]